MHTLVCRYISPDLEQSDKMDSKTCRYFHISEIKVERCLYSKMR